MKKVTAFLLAGLLLLGVSVYAEDWTVLTVDNEGDVGYQTKSWYDSQGQPHMLYLAPVYQGTALYHIRWSGAGWIKQIVYQSSGNHFIGCLDMVQLSADQVAISFGSHSVLYSTWNGATWTTTTALSNAGGIVQGVAVVFDADARPHIFCAVSEVVGFRHLFLSSSSVWQVVETVNFGDQDGPVGANYDVAIDSQNHIYLVYRTTTGKLKMAYYNGTVWGTEYIEESSASVGTYCRIILDDSDVPNIVYYDATNTQLKYATWQGSPKANEQDGR